MNAQRPFQRVFPLMRHRLPFSLAVAIIVLVSSGATEAAPTTGAREQVHPHFTSHGLVLRDGAVMAYYVRKGLGPTLVLIPGTYDDKSRFLAPGYVDQLRPDLGLVVVEHRGQGASWPPPPRDKCSVEEYANDVLAVVDQLKPSFWYVSGHSLGGMLAIEIAGRSPPGLCGVIPLEGWPHHTVEKRAFPAPLTSENEKAANRKSRKDYYELQGWTAEQYANVQQIWSKWTGGAAILAATEYPIFTIWGDRSLARLPGRELLQLPERPNIEIAWVHGGGHNLMDAAFAGEVARLTNEFITRVERTLSRAPAGGAGRRPRRAAHAGSRRCRFKIQQGAVPSISRPSGSAFRGHPRLHG